MTNPHCSDATFQVRIFLVIKEHPCCQWTKHKCLDNFRPLFFDFPCWRSNIQVAASISGGTVNHGSKMCPLRTWRHATTFCIYVPMCSNRNNYILYTVIDTWLKWNLRYASGYPYPSRWLPSSWTGIMRILDECAKFFTKLQMPEVMARFGNFPFSTTSLGWDHYNSPK